MNFLSSYIPHEYIQALGWTLLHSIWQAALIALIVGILMILVQKSSHIRYIIAASAMPLILICALGTFYLSFDTAAQGIDSDTMPGTAQLADYPMMEQATSESQDKVSLQAQFKAYFSTHFPLIITLWFLGIIVLSLRFLGGLAYVQRLKHYKVVDVTEHWQRSMQDISDKIGLSRPVQLLESALVAVPMVVGYFKPVILLPIGAITGLSSSQVESILAHEMAHILRKDYLVNMIQTVIEIIFFYHPAIWWISRLIREERENCCDDIVIQVKEDTLVYAKALTTLGELQVRTPRLAMAATGSHNFLFKRIKRMLTKTKQHPTFSEGFLTAFIVCVCLFCFTLVARASLKISSGTYLAGNVTDMAVFEEGDINAVTMNIVDDEGNNDNLIIIRNKKGKIVELYVNGRKIPRSEIKKYEPMIEESLAENKDAQSIGKKFGVSDEIALQNMVKELEEESYKMDKAMAKSHARTNVQTKHPDKEHGRVFNGFIRKTMEIAQKGIEIGALSMKLESLQKSLHDPGADVQKSEKAIKKLKQEIAAIEQEVEKIGKELEASGEDIGRMSLDMTSTILDSVLQSLETLDFDELEEYEENEQ